MIKTSINYRSNNLVLHLLFFIEWYSGLLLRSKEQFSLHRLQTVNNSIHATINNLLDKYYLLKFTDY